MWIHKVHTQTALYTDDGHILKSNAGPHIVSTIGPFIMLVFEMRRLLTCGQRTKSQSSTIESLIRCRSNVAEATSAMQ